MPAQGGHQLFRKIGPECGVSLFAPAGSAFSYFRHHHLMPLDR